MFILVMVYYCVYHSLPPLSDQTLQWKISGPLPRLTAGGYMYLQFYSYTCIYMITHIFVVYNIYNNIQIGL